MDSAVCSHAIFSSYTSHIEIALGVVYTDTVPHNNKWFLIYSSSRCSHLANNSTDSTMCLRFYMHTTVVWIVSVRIVSKMWRGRMFYAQLVYFDFLDTVDFHQYILRVYTQVLHRWWCNTRLTRLVKSESVTLHSVENGITTTMQQQQGLPQPPSGWRVEILCREQSISMEATPCFDNLTTRQREGSTFFGSISNFNNSTDLGFNASAWKWTITWQSGSSLPFCHADVSPVTRQGYIVRFHPSPLLLNSGKMSKRRVPYESFWTR